MVKKVLVVIATVLFIFSSGCLDWGGLSSRVQCILDIISEQPLIFEEADRLNFSTLQNLEIMNYSVSEEHSSRGRNEYSSYSMYSNENKTRSMRGMFTMAIKMTVENTTTPPPNKYATLSFTYMPYSNYTKIETNKTNETKEFLKNETIKIATVLNLTLNWNNATWYIRSYWESI